MDKINFSGKVNIKRCSIFNRIKNCNFSVEHPTLKNLDISTKHNISGDSFETNIVNNGIKLAKEFFDIDKKSKTFNGRKIHTLENYRGKHLAEILRLSSIITMLENGLKKIQISSFLETMPFHAKYKFKPKVTNSYEAICIIRHIANSKNKELAKEASTILKNQNNLSTGEVCKLAENLIKRFSKNITPKKVTRNRIHVNIIDMTLTKEDVIKNKDFFNSLFKKHNIEYKI